MPNAAPTADIFRGQVVDATQGAYTVQLTGTTEKLEAFIEAALETAADAISELETDVQLGATEQLFNLLAGRKLQEARGQARERRLLQATTPPTAPSKIRHHAVAGRR